MLIPCHNAAPYVEEALESAFSQEVDLHEVVVVDDGSTDGTGDQVRAFGDRVRYQWQANTGISGARNAALAQATGDLIAFLDADDVWPQGSLRARLAALREDDRIDYAFGKVEQFVSPEVAEAVVARHRAAAASAVFGAARLAGAMLIRRRTFERVGGFDTSLRIGETLDWVARADDLGIRNQCLPELVLRRRLHATNSGLTHQANRTDYLVVARAALARRRRAEMNRFVSPHVVGDPP
ncbi:MAG: glycosyltransferase family A protein [Gemmatimonadota bacterium]